MANISGHVPAPENRYVGDKTWPSMIARSFVCDYIVRVSHGDLCRTNHHTHIVGIEMWLNLFVRVVKLNNVPALSVMNISCSRCF